MRNLGLAKKALLLALCAALAVPSAGFGWRSMPAEAAAPQTLEGTGTGSAAQTKETNDTQNPEAGSSGSGSEDLGTPVSDSQKITLKKVLISHYNIKKAQIEAAGNGETAVSSEHGWRYQQAQ